MGRGPAREGVEEGGLAHIWKPDDARPELHGDLVGRAWWVGGWVCERRKRKIRDRCEDHKAKGVVARPLNRKGRPWAAWGGSRDDQSAGVLPAFAAPVLAPVNATPPAFPSPFVLCGLFDWFPLTLPPHGKVGWQ